MKTKKQELQSIKKAWSKIEYVLNNKGWNKYGDEYLKLNREESRSHLNFKPSGVYHGLTISEEAYFFSVQQIAKYLYNSETLDAKEFIYTRKSVFMAYSLARNFEDKLKEVLTREEAEHFISLDYCKFAQEDF